MRRFLKIILLIFISSQNNFAQKAMVFSLGKLYDPQQDSGDLIAWKNDGVLIPVRYDSKSQQKVKVSYSGQHLSLIHISEPTRPY